MRCGWIVRQDLWWCGTTGEVFIVRIRMKINGTTLCSNTWYIPRCTQKRPEESKSWLAWYLCVQHFSRKTGDESCCECMVRGRVLWVSLPSYHFRHMWEACRWICRVPVDLWEYRYAPFLSTYCLVDLGGSSCRWRYSPSISGQTP